MNNTENTREQSAETCDLLNTQNADLALVSCEEQKQGSMKEEFEKFEFAVKSNDEESVQLKENIPNEEFLIKSAVSEPQLKLDFSVINKKESFMKIKLPVPRQLRCDYNLVPSSLESEGVVSSSEDGRTYKVCYITQTVDVK